MNESTCLAEADCYFANHPQGRFWREELNPEARLGALRIAEIDIAAAVGTAQIPDQAEVRAAWFEQALYLLTRTAPPSDGNLRSESIEGVGSRTYSGKPCFLAPRAEAILVPYLRSLAVTVLRG